MNKEERIKLQELITGRIDLSRRMDEDEVRERIDEQIKQESKNRHLEISERGSEKISFIP